MCRGITSADGRNWAAICARVLITADRWLITCDMLKYTTPGFVAAVGLVGASDPVASTDDA